VKIKLFRQHAINILRHDHKIQSVNVGEFGNTPEGLGWRLLWDGEAPSPKGYGKGYRDSKMQRIVSLSVDRLNRMFHFSLDDNLEHCDLAQLSNKIDSSEKLVYVLYFFQDDAKINELIELMKNKLPEIIKNSKDYQILIECMPIEMVIALYKGRERAYMKLAIELHDSVSKPFTDIVRLCSLAFNKITLIILKFFQVKPFEMIKTAKDFNEILLITSKEEHLIVIFNKMQDKLPEMINSFENFIEVVERLYENQRNVIVNKVQDKLAEMIKTTDDICKLRMILHPEQFTLLCRGIKWDKLDYMFKTTGNDIFSILKKSGRIKWWESGNKLAIGFWWLMNDLEPEQLTAFCKPIPKKYLHLFKIESMNQNFIKYLNITNEHKDAFKAALLAIDELSDENDIEVLHPNQSSQESKFCTRFIC